MSRLFNFFVLMLLALSVGQAQGIDGKWKGEMQGPNGSMELTFNFKVSADSLTGTVVNQMGEIPISKGKVKGKTFSFDVNVNDMNISHQCILMSDSISMKVQGFQGEPMVMILKRVSESKSESK